LQEKEKEKEQKHLIMLYGPPASGKSIAKKIMLSKLGINNDNYIDINLDDIIGDDNKYRETINTLKKNELTKAEIEQQAIDVYFDTRKKADLVFELLLFITRLYDISLVVEVTGSTFCSMVWWDKILSFFKSKNYKISLIYPFVENQYTLIKRAAERGKQIYRFISDKTMIDSISNAKKNINRILKESIDNQRFDNIYIYNNEDEKFNTLSDKREELIDLFNNNIMYKKEENKTYTSNDESLKHRLDGINGIIYTEDDVLNPDSCQLAY
jgi:tRNA uridine 5-carbamoylmethylation protein Kti12